MSHLLIYGLTIRQVLSLDYDILGKTILENANQPYDEIVRELTRKRLDTYNQTEKAAYSRVISALLDGPDTLDI